MKWRRIMTRGFMKASLWGLLLALCLSGLSFTSASALPISSLTLTPTYRGAWTTFPSTLSPRTVYNHPSNGSTNGVGAGAISSLCFTHPVQTVHSGLRYFHLTFAVAIYHPINNSISQTDTVSYYSQPLTGNSYFNVESDTITEIPWSSPYTGESGTVLGSIFLHDLIGYVPANSEVVGKNLCLYGDVAAQQQPSHATSFYFSDFQWQRVIEDEEFLTEISSKLTTISSTLDDIEGVLGNIYTRQEDIRQTLLNSRTQAHSDSVANTNAINNQTQQQQADRQADQSAVSNQQTATNQQSANATAESQQQGTTLMSAFANFVNAVTGATPSDCVINMDMGNLDLGNVDLCQLSPPSVLVAVGTVVSMALIIALSISTVNVALSLYKEVFS